MAEMPLYPQNACPGCERGEAIKTPLYANLPVPPEKLYLHPTFRMRIHLPSETLCLKFVLPEGIESAKKSRVLSNARLMTKEELLER
jgi:hypothetical protein